MATKKAEFVRCDSGGPGCKDCPHARIHQRVKSCTADVFCSGCKPIHTEVRWVPVAPDGRREYGFFTSVQSARVQCTLNSPHWAKDWPAAKKLGWRVQKVYVVEAEG